MSKPFNSLIILLTICFSTYSFAISLKDSPVGENRIKFNRKDVNIIITNLTSEVDIKAIVDNSSFEWMRVNNVLLVPRVRLKIKINSPNPDYHIQYKDVTTSFQQSKKSSFAELYYSLYEKNQVLIFESKKHIATLEINFNDHKKQRVLTDYSCSRNNIRIEGLEKEHLTIGCYSRRIGSFGKEKSMLEIQWISPELKIIDSDYVPYQAAFLNKRPVKINVINTKTNKQKVITIHATVPKRVHRLFTAYGFGPYSLETDSTNKDGKVLKKKAPVAPALFFYLNYKISDTTSIRGFDAAIFQESKFNNAGIYLGSDFGFSFDNKLYFTTLLGVQYLYFKFDDLNPEVSEPIFPQGLEFMYRHLFGDPNYIVSGGIFLSTTESIEYENVWLRWGKNYFWELNLISWGKDDFHAKTWGLSVGFPFKGFL